MASRIWRALAVLLVPLPLPALAQTFNLPLNQYGFPQQVSGENVSSFAFVSPQKSLLSLTVKNGASAGFAIVADASAAVSGAASFCTNAAATRPCIMWCVPMAANSYVTANWSSPMSFQIGPLAMFSTTGCGTLTLSATALFMGQAP
jgi:hypothetical protein